jgi:hypothetical protein
MPCAMLLTFSFLFFFFFFGGAQQLGHCTLVSALPSMSVCARLTSHIPPRDIKGKTLGVPVWELLGGKVYVMISC